MFDDTQCNRLAVTVVVLVVEVVMVVGGCGGGGDYQPVVPVVVHLTERYARVRGAHVRSRHPPANSI